jgi:hypothetical protein
MHLSKRHYILGGLLLFTTALPAVASRATPSEPLVIPAKTPVRVTLDQALASNHSSPGDCFAATISEPVIVDGKVVIPQGARVQGRVLDAHASGRLVGRARLQLALESVEVNGKSYEIRTDSFFEVGGSHKRWNLTSIGGGSGGGLIIGAIAGGAKGALLGGPIGAGAGTAAAYFAGKRDVKLPVETRLNFKLAEPLTVDPRS